MYHTVIQQDYYCIVRYIECCLYCVSIQLSLVCSMCTFVTTTTCMYSVHVQCTVYAHIKLLLLLWLHNGYNYVMLYMQSCTANDGCNRHHKRSSQVCVLLRWNYIDEWALQVQNRYVILQHGT